MSGTIARNCNQHGSKDWHGLQQVVWALMQCPSSHAQAQAMCTSRWTLRALRHLQSRDVVDSLNYLNLKLQSYMIAIQHGSEKGTWQALQSSPQKPLCLGSSKYAMVQCNILCLVVRVLPISTLFGFGLCCCSWHVLLHIMATVVP